MKQRKSRWRKARKAREDLPPNKYIAEQLVRRGNVPMYVCIMYTVCRNAIMAKTDYENPEKNKMRVQKRPLK